MKYASGQKNKDNIELKVNEESGLLDFMLKSLTKKSRNNVKSFLTHREVLVDGRVVTRHDYVLKPGQTVKIIRSSDRGIISQKKPDIIYEDRDIIVISKPAGLLSIASDREREQTAYHILTEHVRLNEPGGRIFVVHRLDRETSGVLLFAKSERLKQALQDNWGDLVIRRSYIAVVEGIPEDKAGRIRSWLRETKTLLVYSSHLPGDGAEAVTNYKVIKESKDYAMLEIGLETGRKNQIRVHMKDIGTPVAGDKKYGASTNPLKRLGLHADILELKHPYTGKIMCFKADIPKVFNSLF